jgi:RNA polymerase sigma-70 factor (ECF subfamily)
LKVPVTDRQSSLMSSPDNDFGELLRRVRAGDANAAAELVRLYEPEIRRIIRFRLTDPRLRRVVDSMDICQSVLGNFFVRASLGEFDLERPADLIALLVNMVRNKVIDQTRRSQARKRDGRRVDLADDSAIDRVPSRAPSPDRVAADRDLLATVRERLTDDERYLADQRAAGREWRELADELQTAPDALRKKLSRALDRVANGLDLEGLADGRR